MSRRLLQINPVIRLSTSTGRIMREIGEMVMSRGWESYMGYSRGRDGIMECNSRLVPIGNRLDVALHGIATRMADRHGLHSTRATLNFINSINEIKPDIIHIHNIHGYFLNYPLFFDYLAQSKAKVIWTVHDCWLYTGHCYHYSFIGCDKWQTGCSHCPQRLSFPRSWAIDRSERNFSDKRRAFTSLSPDRFLIVPVSEWMRNEMDKSFLKNYPFRVVHNGIDLDTFKPTNSSTVRERYNIPEPNILLGIASIWLNEKGLPDFIKMSELLNADERIVLVGKIPDNFKSKLPDKITHINRTDNIHELAKLYSASRVLLNPTWQDNYPTVNLEAIACGTPVVTYRTGGSPESITELTGRIVEQGDYTAMLSLSLIHI